MGVPPPPVYGLVRNLKVFFTPSLRLDLMSNVYRIKCLYHQIVRGLTFWMYNVQFMI